jgi:hypothetical protein
MMTCIATYPEHHEAVSTAFCHLEHATITAFHPVTKNFCMIFLGHPHSPNGNQVTTAIAYQLIYVEEHTQIIMTGLGNTDPFSSITGSSDDNIGTDSPPTLAEQILNGMILDNSGQERENLLHKLTVDSTKNRYYFTPHKDDANDLIQYCWVLVPCITKWLGLLTPFKIHTSEAAAFRRKQSTSEESQEAPDADWLLDSNNPHASNLPRCWMNLSCCPIHAPDDV